MMGGCLKRIGCLVLLAVLAAVGWVTRDRWLPYVWHRPGAVRAGTPAPGLPAYELVTPESATQGKNAINHLSGRAGPVFANLSGAEFTGYVVQELSRQLPASAMGTTSSAMGDQLMIRTMLRPGDFGGDKLGIFKGVLGEREPVEFGGTLEIVRPGLGQYTVTSLKIRDIAIPSAGIPSVLAQLSPGGRPDRIGPDAMALVVPIQVADIRVHAGKITLYRTGQ
jgi:hypothetical protein